MSDYRSVILPDPSMMTQVAIFPFLLCNITCNIPLHNYPHQIFFTQSLNSGHVLAVVNNAAENTGAQTCFHFIQLYSHQRGRWISGRSTQNRPTALRSGRPSLRSQRQRAGFPVLLILILADTCHLVFWVSAIRTDAR